MQLSAMPERDGVAVDTAIFASHDIMLTGLSQVLGRTAGPKFRIVRPDATSAPDLILYEVEGARPHDPHDIRLHDLLRRTAATVVVTCWDKTAPGVAAALRCGAHGAISLRLSAEEFCGSIVDILDSPACSAAPAARTVAACDVEILNCGLTVRELEVLGLIADGCSNQEIAHLLFVSINTVKTYIRTGYRKIGVKRRSQAVKWAATHRISRPEWLVRELTSQRSILRPSHPTRPTM